MPPVALTIAGSDPGGAAGLQADLKTFHAFGVYGASVVTALTAQDTTAVHAILHVDPRFVGAQLDVLYADGALHELGGPRVGERPAHGAGCTLSAAITAGLAMGSTLADAVARAQRYVHRALASAPPIGRGSAPLNHLVTPERGNDECTPHRIAPPSARC